MSLSGLELLVGAVIGFVAIQVRQPITNRTLCCGRFRTNQPKRRKLGPNNELANRYQRRRGTSANYEFESEGYDSVGYANRPADYALGGSRTPGADSGPTNY